MARLKVWSLKGMHCGDKELLVQVGIYWRLCWKGLWCVEGEMAIKKGVQSLE